ncbi:MAG: ComF family protein [Pseudomonadota bacterium]
MGILDTDMARMSAAAKAGLRSVADFVWPARSVLTGERHGGEGGIAPEDFAKLRFLNGGGCRTCGAVVEVDLGPETICGACAAKAPRWDQARAALAYDDVTRQMILEFKHGGRRDGLGAMGTWMAMAGSDVLEDTDWLVPVPLHYQRLVRRGFNQAGWLAQAVSRRSGVGVMVDGLKRVKATPSQGGLTARQRQKNVAGAFAVRDARKGMLKGATVTLVDDVYTTGSTLSAATLALNRAGVARVNLLVLARVVRDTDVTI